MNYDQITYPLRARLIRAQNERDELSHEVELLKAELAQVKESRDMYREFWEYTTSEYSKLRAKQQQSTQQLYYGIVDNRIERLVLIDEMPGRGGYTYFHTYDTEETVAILEDGQWIVA